MKLKETKRDLARVETILREKALQSQERLSMESEDYKKSAAVWWSATECKRPSWCPSNAR